MSSYVNPNYYKLFSLYIGKDLSIVPEDVTHNVIESIMNPPSYRAFFEDKSMFDRVLPQGLTPKTFLRRIDGGYQDEVYHNIALNDDRLFSLINGQNRIIVKQTVDSISGPGV